MTEPVSPTTPNTWRPDRYVQHASFVPALARDLVGWLEPKSGERVLDLGCGDGVLSMDLVRAGADVVGVDASGPMTAAARAKGVDARLGAAESLPFDAEFDAAFSNAMLHWTRDIDAVLSGVYRALRAGGRFVGEFGGAGNIAIFLAATESVMSRRGLPFVQPWYFPTPAAFADALTRAGFRVDRTQHFARPTPLPAGITEWIGVFGGPLLAHIPAAERSRLAQEIEDVLTPTLRRDDGTWTMDYVRLRFQATKPGAQGNRES
ncbi:MAG: methyltransferase domain-containing protein [Acidobacteriota bacterium]